MIRTVVGLGVIFASLLITNQTFAQLWRTNSGYDALLEELGANIPDGTGIEVSQVEAPIGNGGYKANPNDSDFQNPDKNFTDLSGINNTNSGHANNVATFFFSNVASAAPGVLDIFQYEANNWINVATGLTSGGNPAAQPFAVQNHSWIAASGLPASTVDQITARVDYMANENDMCIVVGTSNGSNLPQLCVQGYNTITVGKTDGDHASGLTQFFGPGRVKPEIVATGSATSWTTPRVSATAALLREAASGTNADNNELIKSIILAGATKVEFADWDRTESRPLDQVYGVGELNIYNSYKILMAGETDGQTSVPVKPTGSMGWDHGTIQQNQTLNYSIELTEPADHLSILLTWNIDVVDSNTGSPFQPSATLSDMDLFFAGNGITDFSLSDEHNIEHVYLRDVPAGIYTIAILSNRADDFSLAWRTATESEVAPTSVSVVTGKNSGGSISDLLGDDNSYYEVQPAPITSENTFGAVVELESTSPVTMENSIQLDLNCKVGTPNVDQKIELYNFTDENYVLIDQASASFAETGFSAYLNGEPYDFVDPTTGTLRARISWTQIGPVFQSPWTVRIDKASFVVSN